RRAARARNTDEIQGRTVRIEIHLARVVVAISVEIVPEVGRSGIRQRVVGVRKIIRKAVSISPEGRLYNRLAGDIPRESKAWDDAVPRQHIEGLEGRRRK